MSFKRKTYLQKKSPYRQDNEKSGCATFKCQTKTTLPNQAPKSKEYILQNKQRRNGVVHETIEERSPEKRRDAVCTATDKYVEERTTARIVRKKF